MANQEKVTLCYSEFPCKKTVGTVVAKSGRNRAECRAEKFYIVENSCSSTEGFETILRGFHKLVLKDQYGKFHSERRKHEQFILMEKGEEAIIIWYPDTEARGTSYADAMKNAQQIRKRRLKKRS